jgi:hypothetical protein
MYIFDADFVKQTVGFRILKKVALTFKNADKLFTNKI